METHGLRSERAIAEKFRESGQRHADLSGGTIDVLPYDPAKYPGQSMDVRYLKGNLQPSETGMLKVAAIATSADERFPDMVATLVTQDMVDGRLSRIGEELKQGNNVILASGHGSNVLEPGLELAAVSCALGQRDYYEFRSSIVVGKLLPFLKYRFHKLDMEATCTDVLKTACSDIYITIPDTESTKEMRLNQQVVDRYNLRAAATVMKGLRQGGVLLEVAFAGRTNRPSEEDRNILEIGEVSDGTVKMVSSNGRTGKNLVVPVATWMASNPPVIEICDEPKPVVGPFEERKTQVNSMISTIAAVLNQKVEDKHFRFLSDQSVVTHLGERALFVSD